MQYPQYSDDAIRAMLREYVQQHHERAMREWDKRRQALDAITAHIRVAKLVQYDGVAKLATCNVCGGTQADQGADIAHAADCWLYAVLEPLGDVYTMGPPR